LIEVLVAMFIMSIMAVMAWRGVDGLFKVKEVTQAQAARSLRLAAVMEQWERDLQQLQTTSVGRPLRFDGAALRLTRHTPEGLRVVVWTVQQGGLYRWSSAALTSAGALQEAWRHAQQWTTLQADAVQVLDDVSQWQVYYRRLTDNAWSNAQSSANRQQEAAPVANVDPGTEGEAVDTADDSDIDDTLPQGVRLILTLPQGLLQRDVQVQAAP
jgi:general secretion pathway protein J